MKITLGLVVHYEERRANSIVAVHDQFVVVQTSSFFREDLQTVQSYVRTPVKDRTVRLRTHRVKSCRGSGKVCVIVKEFASFPDDDLVEEDGLQR